ncbi:phosphate ABC transporter permease subunit PstC [Lysinibacillus sp. NPDC097279]|uniref:phosphate ABC transporter permease subunit PstC n=1 Tax=Bacillati TaxID=1783272 RepID=UPI001170C5AC|nr:phosphate ABC transporter permease subunit PstC [Lysinibacillus sp. CD3-6]QPQ35129.1 phosphate ABC transporter permease subunit PstC [Lysinibacillus sp. JNUCC-52]UED78871.1 phosphate ABC transporter permease subunit PstC [Lysinibacillus sp. CD3-6]
MVSHKENKTSSVQQLIANSRNQKTKKIVEKAMPALLFSAALISILTTFGIVFTLIFETFEFFKRVSITDFLFGTQWLPFSGKEPLFGILPLIAGTLKVTFIAVAVAVPFGIASAIYLSEYASEKIRRTVKPILEVLAGVPTIVYGFFALTFVTPLLQEIIPQLKLFNALSPGIVVGIMILPMITSLSEDAMSSVPNSMREGALALGATKFEVAIKVVLPAALSGIIASVVLAISRAIGETMIVSLAGGSTPKFNLDVTDSIQTMTAYIVQVSTGDAGYGTTIYYSIYSVGFTLFIFTLMMNLLAHYISKRFREVY